MNKINIGTEIDLNDLLISRMLIQANSGGGFNNALARLNTLELIKREGGKISLNPELLELL